MSASGPGEQPRLINGNSATFRINIRTSAQTFELEVHSSTTVQQLKQLIEARASPDHDLKDGSDGKVHLMLNPWQEMELYLSWDEAGLGRENVREGSTVAVVTRPVMRKVTEAGGEWRLEYRLI